MIFFCSKKPILLLISTIVSVLAVAQKLPNKQQVSLWSPDSIKIDGKPEDAGGRFAAYNKTTRLFYSISNNSGNICLIARTADRETIRKIMSYGLTFTVNSSSKKNSTGLQLTLPMFKKPDDQKLILTCLKADPSVFLTDTVAIHRRLDNIVYTMNSVLGSEATMVKVSGIARKDTLLNNNNATGINAASLFTSNSMYTLAAAIPLIYLADHGDVISYTIKINGTPAENIPTVVTRTRVVIMTEAELQNLPRTAPVRLPEVDYAAEFSGEYNLARKK
jgi:hypothetical protein